MTKKLATLGLTVASLAVAAFGARAESTSVPVQDLTIVHEDGGQIAPSAAQPEALFFRFFRPYYRGGYRPYYRGYYRPYYRGYYNNNYRGGGWYGRWAAPNASGESMPTPQVQPGN